jgi:hypothetical protein
LRPKQKGHGVPKVMDAIYYHDEKIRLIAAAIKSVVSALSIGSGGSVGREGPIIQIICLTLLLPDVRVTQYSQSVRIRRHYAVLDAVMDHLHEVPRAVRAACR